MAGFTDLRVGHGFDVHAFAADRPLKIGGMSIPYHLGLLGHSDADVLLHALTDAMLGALAWGDIGGWFPDSDPAFKDIDSSELLSQVCERAAQSGWKLVNCDSVIMAEAPKFAEFIPQMREVIAVLLRSDPSRVGIKATTTERLGFVGRREGIAASATVLLAKT